MSKKGTTDQLDEYTAMNTAKPKQKHKHERFDMRHRKFKVQLSVTPSQGSNIKGPKPLFPNRASLGALRTSASQTPQAIKDNPVTI